MNWKSWLKGLIAAVVGGAANTGAAVIVAPETFNFGTGLGKLLSMIGAGAIIALLHYLQQSPVPRETWTEAERAEKKNGNTPT